MNRIAIIGAVGLAAVVIAIGLNFWVGGEVTDTEPTVAGAPAPEPKATAEPEASPPPTPSATEAATAETPEPNLETPETAPAAEPEPAPSAPAQPAPAEVAAPAEPAPAPETEEVAVPTEPEPAEPSPASETVEVAAPAEPEPVNPAPAPAPAEVAPAEPEPAAPTEPEDAAAPDQPTETERASAPAAPETPAPEPPSFDVVRIDPAGDAVLAGRAEAGAMVTIFDGPRALGTVTADSHGEWVFVPTERLPPGAREFTLSARHADGSELASESNVVLVVPEPGKDIAGQPAAEEAGSLALKVPSEGTGPSTVLQKPSAEVGASALSLEVVDVEAGGSVILSGKLPPGERAQVYLDDDPLGVATADEQGAWRLAPQKRIEPGVYTFRIDQLDSEGMVVARLEVPFQQPESLVDLPPGVFVIVEPGNSLWRIARRTYGRGIRYSVIFDANDAQIADPNLIYPGQVFMLPRIN